jgi:hypothetical protein
MSIVVTLVITENSFELQEKLATLVSLHAGEIKLVKIEKCPDASFDGTIVISDVGEVHGAAISARIVSQANDLHLLEVDDSLGKIGIVGFGNRRGNENLVSIVTDKILDKQFSIVDSADKSSTYKFSDIKKFPLPRQCKNAQKNHSPGMRKR